VITVGAVTSTGATSSFSSDGPTADGRVKPELMARGSSTHTVSPSSATAFRTASGTSLSTPLAAAAVACLVQARPGWSVDTMREQLFRNADWDPGGTGFDPTYVRGYGILDALATYQATTDLTLWLDEAEILWTSPPAATAFDVVRGDLGLLRASGGDFALATGGCMADDAAGPSLAHGADPAPDEAAWWLVRGVGPDGPMTYDSAGPSQAASRDPGIGASGLACP
jgi:subtilisin family serine protease